MSDTQVELDVFAAVGKLIVSQLEARDELARAIFVALAPQFEHRSYPALKTLTHIVLEHVKEEDPETKDEIIARLQGGPSQDFCRASNDTQINRRLVMFSASKAPPNAPSKTPNPSGPHRGNNPPKGK